MKLITLVPSYCKEETTRHLDINSCNQNEYVALRILQI